MTGKKSPRRKRGAPAGNANAVRHGFYSARFHPTERRMLFHVAGTNLSEEIHLLRVQIHRCLDAEQEVSRVPDPEARLSTLRAISLATDSLTRIIRLQALLNHHAAEWEKFEQGLVASPPAGEESGPPSGDGGE